MSKPLFAVTNRNDPLTITIPRNIIYSASNDVILSFRVLSTNAIPYPDATRDIAGCYVEAGGREPCYCGLSGMLRVLLGDCRVVD